jgi:hypothetical protein
VRVLRLVASTTALIPVHSTSSGVLKLENGGLRAVLECATLAFGLKGEEEQRAVIDGWAELLNSVNHPIQVVIQTRNLNPGPFRLKRPTPARPPAASCRSSGAPMPSCSTASPGSGVW